MAPLLAPGRLKAELRASGRLMAGLPSCLRRGMTLIELLVVVGILLTVAALTVPRLRPMMDHSKIREAARMIQLYLDSRGTRPWLPGGAAAS